MNMKYDSQIEKINICSASLAAKNQHNRKYIHLYRPYLNTPLNIVGSFDEAIDKEIKAQNNNNNALVEHFCEDSRCSFGMIADESFSLYQSKALEADSIFSNENAFYQYVDNNYKNFCVDEEEFAKFSLVTCEKSAKQSDYQKSLYARCVLACAWSFGFTISTNNETLINELKNDAYSYLVKNKDTQSITLYGRPSENLIKKYFETDIVIHTEKLSDKKVMFGKLYTTDNIDYYVSGSVALYSGVIPRLCRLKYERPGIGNNDVHKLIMMLGRTSFMTMHCLNHKFTAKLLEHPFLQKNECGRPWSELNKAFDMAEVKNQKKYIYRMRELWNNKEDMSNSLSNRLNDDIEILNEYLSNSWNVHNVNVSGNINTGDGYCIYTKRSNKVSDSGQLFCSVNGGSEIADSNVNYYKNSVQEDIPTIIYKKGQFYFGGELTREAIAELGVTDNSPYWNYLGITSMAGMAIDNNNLDEECKHVLWLHFNVLGEKVCPDTFDSIYQRRKLATEGFENSEIKGYQVHIISNPKENIRKLLLEFLQRLIDWKDILTFLVLFAIIGNNSLKDINNIIALFFVIIYLLLVFVQFINKRKKKIRLRIRNIRIYKKNCFNKFNEFISEKNDTQVDNIYYVLSNLHMVNLIF